MPNSFRRKSQSSVAASDQRRGRRAMPVKSKVAAHHATHARSPREGRARRAAYAQPRLLVLAMLVMLAASVWWAVAQSKKAASTKTAASSKSAAPTLNVPATNFQHPLTPRDIPAIVKTYAERRRIAAKLGLLKDKNGKYGTRRFNLTERDLTPYSASDEREPSYNPNGNFITFVSNGVDTNNDGQIDSLPSAGTPHYHVWIMNRDGSQQRQITGLQTGNLANGQPDPTKDGNRDQRTPTWSPDGNTIVYTDTGAFDSQRSVNPDPAVKTELSTVTNLFSATPTITRITFSGGNKLRPTWSPNGVVIAFAADTYPQRRSGSGPDDPNGAYNASGAYFPLATAPGSNPARSEYDIFLIAPTGVESTVRRLTGGSTDAAGNAADDLNPAYSIANSGQQIYFSSNRTNSGPLTNPARRIWRMNADGTTPQQVSDPTQRRDRIDNATVGSTVVGQATDTDDYPSPSANFGNGERVAFQSNSRIDTSDTTQDNNIWSLLVRGNSPEERSGNSAFVESNVTSSPAAFTQSGINAIGSDNQPINGKDGNGNPITEDKSDDREPGFARSTSGQAQLAELAFASDRRAGAQPGTINPAPRVTPTPLPTATPANPPGPTPTPIDPNNPIVVNGADGGNHDIWVTVSEDFTPPILLPQQTGNQVFPVLAPGPQAASANLTAPRTPEEGLQAGQPVTIAFVVQELESGLSNVHIDIIDAETSGYRFEPSPQGGPGNPQKVNASVAVNVNYETDPAIIDSIDSSNGGFVISDNGPPTEKQAGAVKGDGIYYVQTQYTPPLTQDYYFNIRLTDKQGNSFTYDHIWGFTNKAFTPASNFNSDLFVSDYTVGQRFPGLGGDPRYQTVGDQFGLDPIESYYLNNPIDPKFNGTASANTLEGLSGIPVDTWRILSRGGVPDSVINIYKPTIVQQVDPVGGANDNPPFTKLSRNVADVHRCIWWASPYTGTVISGPGTLLDADTQRRLSDFLNAGGRLCVTGRDVAFALSNQGGASNNFLTDELQASFIGEAPIQDTANNVQAVSGGKFSFYDQAPGGGSIDIDSPEFPKRPRPFQDPYKNDQFTDAALNQTYGGGIDSNGTSGIDYLGSGSDPSSVTVAYTKNGNTVGQRVERLRPNTNGLHSRVAFLSFGLEGVNRRYSSSVPPNPSCWNVRRGIASGIREYYLKTGGVTGRVVNATTNQPVVGFLVEADGPGGPYYARTDANGTYTIVGVPLEGFEPDNAVVTAVTFSGLQIKSANPAGGVLPNDRYVPNNGFGQGLFGQATESVVDLRVIPKSPGSLSGVVTQSNGTIGTATSRSDDTPLPNIPVLVKSVQASPDFPNGGKYADLTTTDAAGNFAFSNVPAGVQLQVVFNPKPGFESAGGDIPDNSGIQYGNGATIGPRSDVGRRIIPDAARDTPIVVPTGNPFILNDTDTNGDGISDVVDDPGTVNSALPLLVPVGPTINGKVFLNNTKQPASGVTVTLLQNGVAFRSTLTIADGSFSFPDVPPKLSDGSTPTYSLVATVKYAGTQLTSPTINLGPVTQGTDLNAPVDFPYIILSKQDVSGTVLFNNQPIRGAVITLTASNGSVVPPNPSGSGGNVTDAQGHYLYQNVPPGTYTVTATYPTSPLNLTQTKTLTVVAGNDYTVDFALFARTVSGNVNFTSGSSATTNPPLPPGAKVELLDVNLNPVLDAAGNPFVTTTDASGNYSFALVPPGNYRARASITLIFNGVSVSDTDISPIFTVAGLGGANVTVPQLNLFLESITGRAFLNGTPVGGITVNLYKGNSLLLTTTTNSQGIYRFDNLDAGTYTLQATNGTASGPVNSLPVTVTLVRQEGTRTGVDLRLITQGISGTVTLSSNGGPAVPTAGATVELRDSSGNVVRTTISASDGTYRFSGLQGVAPGNYTLRASQFGDVTPDVPVVVRAGQDNSGITLQLFLESISGRVTLNGTPFQGAKVELLAPDDTTVLDTTTSGTDGSFVFTSKTAGKYILRVSATASQLGATGAGSGDVVELPITVVRGINFKAAVDLQLVLASISGRVLLNGQPIAGATVNLTQNGTVLKTVVSGTDGSYSFTNLLPGSYTIEASKGGDSAAITVSVMRGQRLTPPTVPDIQLFLETVTGKVLLNGKPIKGVTVLLIQDRITRARVATDAAGNYSFTDLLPGSYAVEALYGGDQQTIIVRLQRGVNVTAPLILLKLETATGRVLLNGKPVSGATVVLTQGTKTIGQKITGTDGTYSFTNLPAGAYRVTASKAGVSVSINVTVVRGVNLKVPDIQLRTQTITGQVLLNGAAAVNATVLLIQADGTPFGRTTTGTDGRYSFANLPAGTYTVRAIVKNVTKDLDINVRNGVSVTLPAIRITIATPTPTPTPGPTPTPSGPDDFVVGQTYQITIPYADSTVATAATTPAKAFTLPMVSNGVQNYRLFRYNARTEQYDELSNTSALHRGEGYFLRPEASGVSLRRPPADPTRKAMGDTKFTIVLHNNPSIAATDPHNGFNLIGSPFNPAIYTGADFLNSQVILPNGHVYNTVNEAVAAGIISGSLFTFDETTGDYTEVRGNLTNFTGYYVRTFVDGVRLVLKPNLGG